MRRPTKHVYWLLVAALAILCACATGPGLDGRTYQARIQSAMVELGASEKRAACFAERLTAAGDAEASAEAAQIAESAQSKEDMRERVLAASKPTRRAFVGANMRCMFA